MSDMTTVDATSTSTADQTDTTSTDRDKDLDSISGLRDAGKLAIKHERDAREAAEKAAGAHKAELDRITAEAATAKSAKDEAERLARIKADEDAGSYASAKTTLTSERDAAIGERDALLARVKSYEDRDRSKIDAGLVDILEKYKTFDPGADAPLEQRMAWFDAAKAESEKDAVAAGRSVRIPQTPRANGDPNSDEQAKRGISDLVRNRF